LVLSPSDGSLRFPLAPGSVWNVTFNQTRTHKYPFHVVTENSTLTRRYVCEAYESVTYNEKGLRIRCTTDGAVGETVSWFSPHYRADVRREERDLPPGTVRTYALVSFESGTAPSFFSNPQTVLALIFGLMAAAMLAIALVIRFLPGPLSRFRARRDERRKKKEADAGKSPVAPPAAAPPPPNGRRLPPGAGTGPGNGRGRSL
jgi:hypothetical protein